MWIKGCIEITEQNNDNGTKITIIIVLFVTASFIIGVSIADAKCVTIFDK